LFLLFFFFFLFFFFVFEKEIFEAIAVILTGALCSIQSTNSYTIPLLGASERLLLHLASGLSQ
jgi:hypothetical protein